MEKERPSKKQKEVLDYIDNFIKDNGFGPSYREIMRALGLKSVSTVASHVNGLIARGQLIKRDNSARSLQVVTGENTMPDSLKSTHLAWLRARMSHYSAGSDEAAALKKALEILEKTD